MSKARRTTPQLRIIGGTHRGRKFGFPELPGLRPTGDRVRETLFNWLQPRLPGARCLDLFAGSGALGFEAASRGARQVVMVEQAPVAHRSLQENARLLQLPAVELVRADALEWLGRAVGPFDIVFLDPPFAADLWTPCAERLQGLGLVAAGTLVYLECDAHADLPRLPVNWRGLKHKRAGQVGYHLLEVAVVDGDGPVEK